MTTLYYYLVEAATHGTLSPEDALELRQVLSNKAVKRLLAAVAFERSEVVANAVGWDLMNPKGVADAANAQGRARGLQRALDIIWDAAGGNTQESD